MVAGCELKRRRQLLESFVKRNLKSEQGVRLSPATTKLARANEWFARVGNALDGIIAKRLDRPYDLGERTAMVKVKNYRTADCVVGGFRYNEGKKVVGSLLLGLYDKAGLLNHVGFTSGLKTNEKVALTKRLRNLIAEPGFTGSKPGGPTLTKPEFLLQRVDKLRSFDAFVRPLRSIYPVLITSLRRGIGRTLFFKISRRGSKAVRKLLPRNLRSGADSVKF